MKKKCKKVGFMLFIVFFSFIFLSNVNISASETISVEQMRTEAGYIYGEASHGCFMDDFVTRYTDVDKIFTFVDEVTIEESTMVENIDIVGHRINSDYVSVTGAVKGFSSDENVAIWQTGDLGGFIYAIGQGTCTITLDYNGLKCDVVVKVLNTVDVQGMMNQYIAEGLALYGEDLAYESTYVDEDSPATSYDISLGVEYRQERDRSLPGQSAITVAYRAQQILNVPWTPVLDYRLRNGSYAYANAQVTGVPYSQCEASRQCNATQFISHYNDYNNGVNNSFYTADPAGNEKYNPRYGLDCSGLVSKAWGIPRETTKTFFEALRDGTVTKFEKVGSYSISPNTAVTTGVDSTTLLSIYPSLQSGQAVVKRYYKNSVDVAGHAMLVSANIPSQSKAIFCHAFSNFPCYVTKTYEELKNEYYCPFEINSSYYTQYNS
jgi:hypothetical protein